MFNWQPAPGADCDRQTESKTGRSARRALRLGAAAMLLVGLMAQGSVADDNDGWRDRDRNGVEDLLDNWRTGRSTWQDLRAIAGSSHPKRMQTPGWPAAVPLPAESVWARGRLRLVWLERSAADLKRIVAQAAKAGGACTILHDLNRFGGVSVLAVDEIGLREFLDACCSGRVMLDRDGVPALDHSRAMVGVEMLRDSPWRLRGDWTATVAILDSGCDTAHDDLGDFSGDNADGPPPKVGDALDWFDAEAGWPIFSGYKVMGWHDVTDDFPAAVGPWDYHYHGTALAGIVAGEGAIDPAWQGLAPEARLAIVKFYDFDGIWHQWAGDFLAACDWVLEHREIYRIRVVLIAVNWEEDIGIGGAMTAIVEAGMLPVAAMGNQGPDGGPPGFPARLPQVLTVGGVNDEGAVAAYSSRGTAVIGKPDLVAPGGGLLASRGRITTTDNEPNDTYSDRSGTSLSAAHVAAGAFLLLQALRGEGVAVPGSADEVEFLAAMLKATSAPVFRRESADGQTDLNLHRTLTPDTLSGWGLLQVQAAVEAVMQPLAVGASVTDSLAGLDGRLVLSRRLALIPGTGCIVRALPSSGLDIALEIHNTSVLLQPEWGLSPQRVDQGGAGVLESGVYSGEPDGMAFVAVKRIAGKGRVVLTIWPAPDCPDGGYVSVLGGRLTGWANSGRLAGTDGLSVIFTSTADVDPFGRFIHALDSGGAERPGWPVFLFLPAFLQGALSAPMVWDLDGEAGDEIVVASEFGRVYFLSSAGSISERIVAASDIGLTVPIGIQDASGQPRVVVGDADGRLHFFDGSANLINSFPVNASVPLTPAAGQLVAGGGEELLIGFTDGLLYALDSDGVVLPGWPRQIAAETFCDPVLVDIDGDQTHEIVVPTLPVSEGPQVVFRVIEGDGQNGIGDGASVAAPAGGHWLALSDPAAIGSEAGGWRVTLSGLVARGSAGDSTRWFATAISLMADGATVADPLPGFQVRIATPPGRLQLTWHDFPAPLAWDYRDGPQADPDYYLALGWQEDISGIPNLKGSTAGWFGTVSSGIPALDRHSLWPSGAEAIAPDRICNLVYPQDEESWMRVTIEGRRVFAQQADRRPLPSHGWSAERGDARNRGAAALSPGTPTDVSGSAPHVGSSLALWPNPSAGEVCLAWRNIMSGPATLKIYDLRGRLVRNLRWQLMAQSGQSLWDGRDMHERPVSAGTYLFVMSSAGETLKGRVVLTR